MARAARIGAPAVLLVLFAVSPARAQTSEHDQANAAFEEGRRLVQQGRCPDAIEKFKASLTHEPSIGARLSLAQCYEASDPLQAWRELKEAEVLASAKGDPRGPVSRDRATALEPKLATIRLVIPAATTGLELRLDGARLDKVYYDTGSVAVEPRSHTLEATAPGKARWSMQVEPGIGKPVTVTITFEDAKQDATPAAPEPAKQPPPQPAEPPAPAQAPNHTAAFVVGGIGLAGVAFGTVTGIVALHDKSTVTADCGGSAPYPTCPTLTSSAKSDNTALKTMSTLSTIGFGVGAAGLIAGAVLYFTASRTPSSTGVTVVPLVGRSEGGMAATGSF